MVEKSPVKTMNYEPNQIKPVDFNFNKNQIIGLKKFTIGAGSNKISIIGGKMWGGSNTFDTGIFKLDLGAKTLSVSGTINATAGVFTGDITMSGTLSAGADDASKIVLDGANKKLSFYNDSGALAASLYNYQVSGGSSKSIGLDAASGAEVKLSVGLSTRLVAKTVSSKAVVEFYGQQRIYSEVGKPLAFDCDISPLTDYSKNLGSGTYRWNVLYLKGAVNVDGSNGVSQTYTITTPSGDKDFEFKGGVLVNVD